MTPILSIVLGVDKRRGEEEPIEVLRIHWALDELPTRATFFTLIEEAYGEIELPYFPFFSYVAIETENRRARVVCEEPVDEPYNVGLALWNGILAATTGDG